MRKIRKTTTAAVALLLSLAVPAPALAEAPADAGRSGWMQYNLPIDLSITAVGAVAWLTTEALKPQLAPSTCRWCEPPALDLSVKHALRWDNHTKAADVSSYVTGFALAPLAAYGLDAAVVLGSGGSAKEWAVDALVITESIVVAADINQLVKFTVGRERPFVHDLSPAEKQTKPSQPADNNLSFFSGHTTLGFSAAVSAGMVATLRGYKAAPYIWATGMTLAVATGYLRIAADKHYFTDVLTGALWGAAAGVVVPLLHRPCTASGPCVKNVSSAPMPGGASFGFSGVW